MIRSVLLRSFFAAALAAGFVFGLIDSPRAWGDDAASCAECNGGCDSGHRLVDWLPRLPQLPRLHCAEGCCDGACDGSDCSNCQAYADNGKPDLFYNYYVPQTVCGGVPAKMYPCPLPTPPLVGHTYYTYQPLMPHEAMYPHKRVYHRYYDGGRGLTRTCVHWKRSPLADAGASLLQAIRVPR